MRFFICVWVGVRLYVYSVHHGLTSLEIGFYQTTRQVKLRSPSHGKHNKNTGKKYPKPKMTLNVEDNTSDKSMKLMFLLEMLTFFLSLQFEDVSINDLSQHQYADVSIKRETGHSGGFVFLVPYFHMCRIDLNYEVSVAK